MSKHSFLYQSAFVLTLAFLPLAGAAPIASNDIYYPQEDSPYIEPAPGVLQNDDPNGTVGALSAVKLTDPAHGVLNLQSDGSFTYTPAANYFGLDSFTYNVTEGQGPITFTVDQNNSPLSVNVQTSVAATGVDDSETAVVRTKGTMTALITPGQAPFSSARVVGMDVSVAQQANLTLCVVELFGGCIGTLSARLEPDGLRILMNQNQAGPAVPVAANGSFSQLGNLLDATGTVFLSTGGVASGIEVPPTADINSTNLAYDFTGATITQNVNTLTLAVPLDITQTFVEPDYEATIHITGTIRATAPVPVTGPASNVATVTLDVTSEDDVPDADDDRYYTRQNHRLNIPAGGSVPVNETLIAGNSTWKYNTGTDLTTTWRAVNFVDTAWPAGTGVLGYGDADILAAGTIPARANMAIAASAANPNYPTAYFRKEFNLTAPGATLDARIEFQRDDACLIWLNGTEVYRDSTPYTGSTTPPVAAAPAEITYASYAAAGMTPDTDGAVYKVVALPTNLFLEGKNVISVMVKQQTNTSSDLRFDLKCFRTAQPTDTLIPTASIWKYSTGTDLGTAWRSPEYNDAAWNSAAGPLGYDTDIAPASTIPARANMAAAASAGNPNYPTAYFRREFTLTTPFDTVSPRVEFQRDDACIIYVNGVEIYRDSTSYAAGGALPFPATGEVAYSSYAAASAAGGNIPEAESLAYKAVTFSRGLLREGRNVIAAEVHQNTNTSSDLRFDLRANRTTGVGGVAVNDTDVDGPAFDIVLHSAPANGSVQLNPDGSFAYTPAPGFPASGPSGTDSFVYRHTLGGQSFNSTSVILPMGGDWKYLDTGVAAPQVAGPLTAADWRHVSFDDGQWAAGGAKLGYGEGDEVTVVEDNATPGYLATDADRYITTYFRRKFDFTGATDLLNSLKVSVIRDDAVAIWLNGTRIVKDGLPDTWDHTTLATTGISGAAEDTPLEVFNIPPGALLQGQNILAVEIHQSDAGSSDISFNMELSAESVVGARVEIVVLNDDLDGDDMSDTWERANGIDATVANAGDDPDNDGQTHRNEFLAGTDPNLGSSAFRAAGLTTAPGNQLQIAFDSVPGRTYHLQHSDALGAWADTGADFSAHPANPQTILQFTKPALPKKFYRVRLVGDWQ